MMYIITHIQDYMCKQCSEPIQNLTVVRRCWKKLNFSALDSDLKTFLFYFLNAALSDIIKNLLRL